MLLLAQLPAKFVEPASMSPPPEKPSQAPKLEDSTAALLSESEKWVCEGACEGVQKVGL